MENNDIFNQVKIFTVNSIGVDEDEISEDTRLESDLGVYGDDAIEYVLAFGMKFNVDVTNFMFSDYFSPEGDFILSAIIRIFTGKKNTKQKELTIRHLLKAIKAGRLDEVVINSS